MSEKQFVVGDRVTWISYPGSVGEIESIQFYRGYVQARVRFALCPDSHAYQGCTTFHIPGEQLRYITDSDLVVQRNQCDHHIWQIKHLFTSSYKQCTVCSAEENIQC